ncbi:response regulator transcription factor [Lentzea sp. E54]|uniref:response regulator transcription factor n=1 Tax=Lentzea xerophila TaxID=3435883 RepID=UPI003DA4C0D0
MSGSGVVRALCFGTPSLGTDGLATAVVIAGAQWCGVVDSASALFRLVARREVDLLLIDVSADPQLCVCELLVNSCRRPEVVLLQGLADLPDDVEVPRGVRAVLSLRGSRSDLVELIRDIAPHGPHVLSPRESQVLQLIAGGYDTLDMARLLMVGPETVRTHVKHLLTKLGAQNRPHAVALACARGLIPVAEKASAVAW